MGDYKIIIQNLEKLRTNYGLEYSEVDEFANLKPGTYQNAIEEKAILNVKELISIVKIYMANVPKIFSPKMRMPSFKTLSSKIKKIASERLGKTEKVIEKKDYIQYCVLLLNRHFKVGNDFTNSQIKGYFKGELETAFKGKSIEWSKSILSPFIADTGETKPGKTKPEKVYKLVKRIPAELVKKAEDMVGSDWLEDK